MNRIILSLSAASLLVFAGIASAAEELTYAQMDGITAAGNAASSALADAFGVNTSAVTSTLAQQVVTDVQAGQLGAISLIQSNALASSASAADAISLASAAGSGVTTGDNLSDTVSASQTLADSLTPMSMASASNSSVASSLIRGWTASASSASTAAAQLANP